MVDQPWHVEDDVDLERLGVDVKPSVEAGFLASNLIATVDKLYGLDALFRKVGRLGKVDVDDVVGGACFDEDEHLGWHLPGTWCVNHTHTRVLGLIIIMRPGSTPSLA
jgi:hypothetical protein